MCSVCQCPNALAGWAGPLPYGAVCRMQLEEGARGNAQGVQQAAEGALHAGTGHQVLFLPGLP